MLGLARLHGSHTTHELSEIDAAASEVDMTPDSWLGRSTVPRFGPSITGLVQPYCAPSGKRFIILTEFFPSPIGRRPCRADLCVDVCLRVKTCIRFTMSSAWRRFPAHPSRSAPPRAASRLHKVRDLAKREKNRRKNRERVRFVPPTYDTSPIGINIVSCLREWAN